MEDTLYKIAQDYLEWFEDQRRDDIGLLEPREFEYAMVMRDYLRLRMAMEVKSRS